jgi:hypothetical protein
MNSYQELNKQCIDIQQEIRRLLLEYRDHYYNNIERTSVLDAISSLQIELGIIQRKIRIFNVK